MSESYFSKNKIRDNEIISYIHNDLQEEQKIFKIPEGSTLEDFLQKSNINSNYISEIPKIVIQEDTQNLRSNSSNVLRWLQTPNSKPNISISTSGNYVEGKFLEKEKFISFTAVEQNLKFVKFVQNLCKKKGYIKIELLTRETEFTFPHKHTVLIKEFEFFYAIVGIDNEATKNYGTKKIRRFYLLSKNGIAYTPEITSSSDKNQFSRLIVKSTYYGKIANS
jgi:hypothetical protein